MRRKCLFSCGTLAYLLLSLSPSSVHCITIQDYRVNSDTSVGIAQYYTDIAFDSLGNFVIVYSDRGFDHDFRKILFQRFDSQANRLGGPVLVSDTTIRYNDNPAIAMHPSGSFVICWGSNTGGTDFNSDVWIQRFDPSGNSLGPHQQVDVDLPDTTGQVTVIDYTPAIAMDRQGNFIVIWARQDSIGWNVYAQRFFASGARIGNNFLVSDFPGSDYDYCEWEVYEPRLAFNPAGYFVICWYGCIHCPTRSPGVCAARIYNPNGEPVTKVIPLFNPCSSKWAFGSYPDVAGNPQNNFVVSSDVNTITWSYPHHAVMVQTFDTLGNPVDTGKIVNDVLDLGSIWFVSRVAVDDSDGYVVLWNDARYVNRNLWAQRFDSSGQSVGQNYRLNLSPGSLNSSDGESGNWNMYDLAIHQNTVGIAWVDFRNYSVYDADVYAKLLDLDKIGFYLRGDVTLDGSIDIGDVIYLINYLFRNGWGIIPEWIGDASSDGNVDIGDVVFLINYLFKGGPPPEPT